MSLSSMSLSLLLCFLLLASCITAQPRLPSGPPGGAGGPGAPGGGAGADNDNDAGATMFEVMQGPPQGPGAPPRLGAGGPFGANAPNAGGAAPRQAAAPNAAAAGGAGAAAPNTMPTGAFGVAPQVFSPEVIQGLQNRYAQRMGYNPALNNNLMMNAAAGNLPAFNQQVQPQFQQQQQFAPQQQQQFPTQQAAFNQYNPNSPQQFQQPAPIPFAAAPAQQQQYGAAAPIQFPAQNPFPQQALPQQFQFAQQAQPQLQQQQQQQQQLQQGVLSLQQLNQLNRPAAPLQQYQYNPYAAGVNTPFAAPNQLNANAGLNNLLTGIGQGVANIGARMTPPAPVLAPAYQYGNQPPLTATYPGVGTVNLGVPRVTAANNVPAFETQQMNVLQMEQQQQQQQQQQAYPFNNMNTNFEQHIQRPTTTLPMQTEVLPPITQPIA